MRPPVPPTRIGPVVRRDGDLRVVVSRPRARPRDSATAQLPPLRTSIVAPRDADEACARRVRRQRSFTDADVGHGRVAAAMRAGHRAGDLRDRRVAGRPRSSRIDADIADVRPRTFSSRIVKRFGTRSVSDAVCWPSSGNQTRDRERRAQVGPATSFDALAYSSAVAGVGPGGVDLEFVGDVVALLADDVSGDRSGIR